MRTQRFVLVGSPVLLALLGAWLLIHAQPPKPAGGKKVALLVGVNQYQSRKLENLQYAEKDMTDLAAVLKRAGFEVRLLLGSSKENDKATRENIETALAATIKGVGKDDTVLLAFSGHGQQFAVPVKDADGKVVKDAKGDVVRKEVPFFCPGDAVPTEPETLVSLSNVLKTLDEKGGGHNLLLVDACRSDSDPNRGMRGGIDGSRVENLGEGTAVFFACSARQKARETEKAGGGHGVFFHFVLEGLNGAPEAKNGNGQVTWERLVPYVKERVKKEFPIWFDGVPEHDWQQPHAIGNLVDDPILVTFAAATAAPNEIVEEFD